jgi:hypothetical protein
MSEHLRIVEINGIKIEVDLRTAKRVDQFKVGDAVKILKKKYSDSYESYFGMIVGFDEFKELPTIIVAYLSTGSYDSALNFEYINSKSKDVEICPHDANDIGLEREHIESRFDREIEKKEVEITDLKRKKTYFLTMFGRYFK